MSAIPIRRWAVRAETFYGVADSYRYSTNGFALAARKSRARDTRHRDEIFRESLRVVLARPALEPTTIDAILRCFRGVKLTAKNRPLVHIVSSAPTITIFDARLILNAVRNAKAEGACAWGIEADCLTIRGDGWLVAVMGVYLRGARSRRISFARPKPLKEKPAREGQ